MRRKINALLFIMFWLLLPCAAGSAWYVPSSGGPVQKVPETFILGGFNITAEREDIDYDEASGVLLVRGDAVLSTDDETTDRIVVRADCTVTLAGVKVKPSGEDGKMGPAMLIESPYNAELVLAGGSNNELTGSKGINVGSTDGSFAGIEVEFEFEDGETPSNRKASLTISGNGELTAKGSVNAAGIGGSNSAGGSKGRGLYGNITIESGTVNAYASGGGAGIGSSNNPNGGTSSGSYKATGNNIWGTITINGGTVKAEASDSGAGIGGGNHVDSGKVIINGGTVTARGAAGIGCGIGSSKSSSTGGADKGPGYYYADVEINGGEITASSNDIGAAIGGGMYCDADVTITGGKITAIGGSRQGNIHHGGAGIGGGYLGHADIEISGEDTEIYAIGGDGAAGIGSGGSPNSNESRGSGGRGSGVTHVEYTEVGISGGTIEAYGGIKGGAGIGLGVGGDKVSVSITGGKVKAAGAESDIESLSGGAGIGSGYRGFGPDPKYFVDGDVDVSITGGEIIAIGGYGASAIGSGAANKMADTITIDAGSASFEAYSDGTKFAIDTRIVIENGDGTTQTTSRKEGRSYNGNILQGTFVHQYDEPDGQHQGTEGLSSIIVMCDSDPDDEGKELTAMPVGTGDELHPGYRSFATNVSAPGSYTVYTDAASIGDGGGRYFSVCTMDGRFVELDDETIIDTKEEGEGVQYRVVTDDLADNFYLFPVKTIAVTKKVLADEEDSPDLSGITMTCYFSIWNQTEQKYVERDGVQWIEPVEIVGGVQQSSAFFADIPDETYSIREVDENGGYLSAGIVYGAYELKRIETEHDGTDDNDAQISNEKWTEHISVMNYYSETIVINVKKIWNDDDDAAGRRPQSLTITLFADDEPTGDTLVLSGRNGWQGSFEDLAKYRVILNVPSLITYTIGEPETGDYETEIKTEIGGTGVINITITNTYENPPVPPVPPGPPPVPGRRTELPQTGFSAKSGASLLPKSAAGTYKPVRMELQIPSLGVISRIVSVEPEEGEYPIGRLGPDAGLLADMGLPGGGCAVIAGHNSLSAETAGPFALISLMSPGDHFFVKDENGSLMIFEVYANRKIGAFDHEALAETAGQFGSTVTLMTCEDERLEGGYASRRIVSGRQIR